MTLKELCQKSHDMAREKGFWDNPRNTSELLMLVVTELGEACEALRNNRTQANFNAHDNNPPNWEKDTFEDEIADSFIRLGDLCNALGIDIEWQIKEKMKYNEERPKKHGKHF